MYCRKMFPVDLPPLDEIDMRAASEKYILSLESQPKSNEWFVSSKTSKLEITARNIKWLELFEDNQTRCSILALHPPEDPNQVLALYLHGSWWCVNDVMRTSCKSRTDLLPVQSLIERLIIFLLSQVVEKTSEEEGPFSLHPRTESAKLLWQDAQAVGFYTVKQKGNLCDTWSSRCYLLPVLDTVLVRRSWRRQGLGLKMLGDFCSSFPSEEVLGISVPLSTGMVAVCRHFLQLNEDQRDRLYEVEAPGEWTQRRNIWLNIRLSRYLCT
ncbi:protein FAM169B [Stigmatopora argus]